MKFDREKFFAGYRKAFGSIRQSQVDALDDLLDFIEKDGLITDLRHVAYMLATSFHETNKTFRPIHEIGGRAYFIRRYGSQTAKGKELGNDTPEEGATYAGRGHVQLTGEYNYETAEKDLRRDFPEVVSDFEARTGRKFDLTVGDDPNDATDPDNAMDAEIAYFIMSNGMRLGRFTRKKLSDYISGSYCNYVAARRIINGTDKAEAIANYAQKFEAILKASSLDWAAGDIQQPEVPDSSPLPVLPPSDEKETAKVTIEGDKIAVEKNVTPAEPERVIIEKPEPVGFIKSIKKKLGIAGGTNLGIQALRDQFDTAKGFGFSPRFWMWVSIIGVVGAVIWIAIEWFHHLQAHKRELVITDALIKANTTDSNKVELLSKEEIERLSEKPGVKIIRR